MKRTLFVSGAIIGMIAIALVVSFREGEQARIPDIIVVGITPDFPPYAYREYSCGIDDKKPEELVLCPKNPAPIGLEVDLIHALSKKMGKQMLLRELPFDALIPSLELGHIHMIAAGMSITPERAERITFSQPYVRSTDFVCIVPQSSPIRTVDQVRDGIVYTIHGQVTDQALHATHNVTIKPVGSLEIALSNLAREGLAVITDLATLAPYRSYWESQQYRLILIPDVDEHIALGMRTESRGLITAINRALKALEHDGSLEALRAKWGVR